jgi:hypothetical protein
MGKVDLEEENEVRKKRKTRTTKKEDKLVTEERYDSRHVKNISNNARQRKMGYVAERGRHRKRINGKKYNEIGNERGT